MNEHLNRVFQKALNDWAAAQVSAKTCRDVCVPESGGADDDAQDIADDYRERCRVPMAHDRAYSPE